MILPDDTRWMLEALAEARRGWGHTSPNPAVGALLLHPEHGVVARGWHRGAGQPHAEVEALRQLADAALARECTLYVTLEPCSTHGRTPPCVEAILRAGIPRVVIGTLDPNPAHAGRAVPLLEAAGVAVAHGVCEAECRKLNRAFNHWIVTRRPWVIAKAGMSLDGRLSRPPGEGQWITSEASRADAQQLRAGVDAILIGSGTLRADNPKLTVRGIPGARQPWRVVVSRNGNVPQDATLFTDEHRERTLLFTGEPLERVLSELGERGVTSVLLEGGSRILGEALAGRLIHEVCLYLAPTLLGGPHIAFGGGEGTPAPRIADPCYTRIGNDLRLTGEVVYPA